MGKYKSTEKLCLDDFSCPQWLFDQLNKEFNFDVDVCATSENAKCERYYTKDEDGLSREWFGNVWCCPSYKQTPEEWILKAFNSNCNTVMLLKAHTHTPWFHDLFYHNHNVEIRFIEGTIPINVEKHHYTKAMMLVIIRNEKV